MTKQAASVGVKPSQKATKTRRYLTPDEVQRLLAAAADSGPHSTRNHLLLLMTFRHGLRVSEATGMLWTDLDLRRRTVHVRRLKGSKDSVQTLKADEIAGLEALRATSISPYVFVSQRGARLSSDLVQLLVRECGERARIGLHCHPHMLRHSCGHAFAGRGVDTRRIQDFLGHQDIRHTTRYTELAASRMADMVLE